MPPSDSQSHDQRPHEASSREVASYEPPTITDLGDGATPLAAVPGCPPSLTLCF